MKIHDGTIFGLTKESFTEFLRVDRETLFRNSLILSFVLHISFVGLFFITGWVSEMNRIPSIEIDLTKPFRIGGNPLLKPGGGTSLKVPKKTSSKPSVPKLIPEPPKPEPKPEPKPALKEWVIPGPETKEIVKPVPEKVETTSDPDEGKPEGEGSLAPGTGGGFGGGDGQGGGIPITKFPKLVNTRRIQQYLKQNYPIIERQAGMEGEVIVDLHISPDGDVTAVEVVGSAGSAFDRVAKKAARRMIFSPAMVKTKPVAVKIRQAIVFNLEDLR